MENNRYLPYLHILYLFPVVSLLANTTYSAEPKDINSRPNIIFILADDAGIADIARYHELLTGTSAQVPTPNLDRLFDEGMSFTDAQLPAALCAPNRFSIITGSYPHRSRPAGTWNRTASSAFHFEEDIDDRIDNPHTTIGTVLQKAGYRCAYLGKTHFGADFVDKKGNLLRQLRNDELHLIDYQQPFGNGPLAHGFDYSFVSPDGIQGPLYMWFENDRYIPISSFASEIDGVADGPPSELRDFAKGDIVGNGEMILDGYGDTRFDTSEHGAIMTHFARKFMEDHLAKHPNQPFMLYYSTPAIHEPLTPAADLIGASGIDLRADFVMDLDRQVGQLLKTIDELNLNSNTLIIFTSDNGAAIKGGEAMLAAGQDPNGPFRGNKGMIYEGGHRVPFIWKWGNGTPEGSVIPPGVICNQLVSVLDWVATVIQLVGGTIPVDQHQDSVSLYPLLFNQDPDTLEPVRRWHIHRGDIVIPRTAVRMDDDDGKWFVIRSTENTPVELYDLQDDLSQKTNILEGYHRANELPKDHPQMERVTTMKEWFLRHGLPGTERSKPATFP